jgi:hypothetical protein
MYLKCLCRVAASFTVSLSLVPLLQCKTLVQVWRVVWCLLLDVEVRTNSSMPGGGGQGCLCNVYAGLLLLVRCTYNSMQHDTLQSTFSALHLVLLMIWLSCMVLAVCHIWECLLHVSTFATTRVALPTGVEPG